MLVAYKGYLLPPTLDDSLAESHLKLVVYVILKVFTTTGLNF